LLVFGEFCLTCGIEKSEYRKTVSDYCSMECTPNLFTGKVDSLIKPKFNFCTDCGTELKKKRAESYSICVKCEVAAERERLKLLEICPLYQYNFGDAAEHLECCGVCSYNATSTTVMEYRLRSFGITVEEYVKILYRQQNKCLLCKTYTKLVLDHCHTNGQARGFICSSCNTSLGHVEKHLKNNTLDAILSYIKQNYKQNIDYFSPQS
jgi:hypothetical protein